MAHELLNKVAALKAENEKLYDSIRKNSESITELMLEYLKETYIGKVINTFQGKLLVNDITAHRTNGMYEFYGYTLITDECSLLDNHYKIFKISVTENIDNNGKSYKFNLLGDEFIDTFKEVSEKQKEITDKNGKIIMLNKRVAFVDGTTISQGKVIGYNPVTKVFTIKNQEEKNYEKTIDEITLVTLF